MEGRVVVGSFRAQWSAESSAFNHQNSSMKVPYWPLKRLNTLKYDFLRTTAECEEGLKEEQSENNQPGFQVDFIGVLTL